MLEQRWCELMSRNQFPLILVLFLLSALWACSSPNSQAPAAGQVHGRTYLVSHASEAEQDLASCKSCHGSDLGGADNTGSCLTCHPDGEPIAIHALPFSDPADHGEAARNNLRQCFACHGSTPNQFDGGFLSNPAQFNAANANCSAAGCHSDAGAHPTRWQGSNDDSPDYRSSHRGVSQNTIDTACAMCHDVVEGDPAPNAGAPSCFSATFTNADGSTTGCHPSGPETHHPVPYTDPLQHGADAKADLNSCVPCHATPADAGAGDNPRFNVAVGDLANGCEDCHVANTAHPTPLWTGVAASSHSTAGRMATACALCHGTSLDGPAGGGTGPACAECHTAGSPLTPTNCASCHNWPPDGRAPAGDRFPNRDGAHAVHNALAGVNGNCGVCHEGAGTESAFHFNGAGAADVSLAPTYDAQNGAARYNANDKTCGTTRCHGGRTTPDWFNGTVYVAGDCRECHSTISGQYNAATSGRHRMHVVEKGLNCTHCHNPTLLADDHFRNLASTGFEGNPGNTLYIGLGYDPNTHRGCDATACHGQPEDW
jgi:predicted CxxxxCH...CXXCH cytochrome family protein